MQTDIAIIGAGLAGLAAGIRLHEAGRRFKIFEARPRMGGRIHSIFDATGTVLGDLGPTWVWPPHQPAVRRWLKHLGLGLFDQYDAGDAIADNGPNQPQQRGFVPGQHGIARIDGYSQALISALRDRLPTDAVVQDAPVTSVEVSATGIVLETGNPSASCIHARHVVCTAPPRVALETINWRSDLPADLTRVMHATPTWMAPQAKAVALYDQAVWRQQGLSGRIISRIGPLAEAHDHSGPNDTAPAIFGFLGWPPDMRAEDAEVLPDLVAEQLDRCFGILPKRVWIEDWALDPYTATPSDLEGPASHPDVGPDILRAPHNGGRLIFAGAETSDQSPGLIDGALASADHATALVLNNNDPAD